RVAVIKNQWNSDYHIMVRELTAYDQERQRNNELSLPPTATARPNSSRFTGPTKTATSRPVRPTPAPILPPFNRTQFLTQPKPDITGRARAAAPAATGNCFKCGKPGHFQDKCPLNATVKEIDCEDPETEESWEEAVELQSDASLEENDEA
ncbi:hypothetical protein V496_01224, partial [Pseudogymnoascus sp. VKM F-4515 (FW-2607)]